MKIFNYEDIVTTSTLKCNNLVKVPREDFGEKACYNCKNFIGNHNGSLKHNVECFRLLNKVLTEKEKFQDNSSCKYYEEYIGNPKSCSSCTHLDIAIKEVSESEFKVIYKCVAQNKEIDSELEFINNECKDYVDMNDIAE